jgi:hypothetical protein
MVRVSTDPYRNRVDGRKANEFYIAFDDGGGDGDGDNK